MSVQVMPKPKRPQHKYLPHDCLSDTCEAWLVPGSRLYGGADINGVRYWHHPPSDLLVRADQWDEIVGDPEEVPADD